MKMTDEPAQVVAEVEQMKVENAKQSAEWTEKNDLLVERLQAELALAVAPGWRNWYAERRALKEEVDRLTKENANLRESCKRAQAVLHRKEADDGG